MVLSSSCVWPLSSVPLGRYWPDQAIGIFIAAALRWTVGVSEVDIDAGVLAVSLACRAISVPRS